ncbi:hypothetical protein AB0N23_14340, partial [Streptomyces sp. NPDC052644]
MGLRPLCLRGLGLGAGAERLRALRLCGGTMCVAPMGSGPMCAGHMGAAHVCVRPLCAGHMGVRSLCAWPMGRRAVGAGAGPRFGLHPPYAGQRAARRVGSGGRDARIR